MLDSGDYSRGLVELAVRQGGLEELKHAATRREAEGRLYGIGYAAVVESGQSNMGYISNILPPEDRLRNPKIGAVSNATVNIDPLGNVTVTADSIPPGPGSRDGAVADRRRPARPEARGHPRQH